MFHVSLEYKFSNQPTRHQLAHPLLEVLECVHETGSIGKAAQQLGRSYRHVWGELKHWESELKTDLIIWGRSGKGAALTPQAIEFLLAVSKIEADLAPHVAHIKKCFHQCISALKNDGSQQRTTH